MEVNAIYNGHAKDVLSKFEKESVDLVVTDPPYLCRYKDRFGRTVLNDDNPDEVLSVYAEIYRVLKPNSYCFTFCGWNHIAEFAGAWRDAGFNVMGHVVWPKPYRTSSYHTAYTHESGYLLTKGYPKPPEQPLLDTQKWEYSGNKSHPTQKAVSVIEPIIKAYSKAGDVVLDPFLGSGTTAVAAALNGRNFIGIDLEQKYCEYAEQRLAALKSRQSAA